MDGSKLEVVHDPHPDAHEDTDEERHGCKDEEGQIIAAHQRKLLRKWMPCL
jgi:hypothetical protein